MKIGSKTKVTREVTRHEQNRRNNIKRMTISGLIAFVLFIALTVIQSSILNKEQAITVYQVANDINAGTKITKDNFGDYFKTHDVQVSLIPDGYITDSSLIIGKFVNKNYKAKDVITVDGLTDSEALYNASIEHPVQVSFSLGSLGDSVSGTIREGDYVNIYGMHKGFNKDGEEVLTSRDNYTFKHIFIQKAYDSSGTEIASGDKTSTSLLFTVVIEEDDVELFNEMVANCDLKLVKIIYDTDQNYQDYVDDVNKEAAKASVQTTTETVETPSTEEVTDEADPEVQAALDELESVKNGESAETTETEETETDGE